TSGEPVLRHMEYEFPHCGYEKIADQFMLGSDILVCPVITKGTREKDVIFPEGKWQDDEGNVYEKGTHTVKTPLEKLTYFRRVG
ncbi:MAG: glycoside hydrolase, partial [Clostridia bacterium]|nr:glycoside hydrolase [Clostridia bacterium]